MLHMRKKRSTSFAVALFTLLFSQAPEALANICNKWQPGHYIRIPVYNSGHQLVSKVLSKDLRNFKGIEYHFEWGALEKSKGKYDFSAIDDAVKQVAAKNKYLILMMTDRTFQKGCSARFVPPYVKKVGVKGNSKFCTAAIWETETMNHRIRVMKALLNRYRSNPRVIGLQMPETGLAVREKETPGFTWEKYHRELVRSYRELRSAAPNMMLIQGMNFPQESHRRGFLSGLVKVLDEIGNGGMSWPDTVPANFSKWDQYDLAKKHNRKVPIAPHVQSPLIKPTDTAKIYDFLVNQVGAHIVVWDHWHGSMQNYLDKQVIPTVNNKKGYIKNKSCPL